MHRYNLLLRGVRNNQRSNVLGSFWRTGGRLIIDNSDITIRTWFQTVSFDRKSVHVERTKKEELLTRKILRIYDADKDFSVQLSARQYKRLKNTIDI